MYLAAPPSLNTGFILFSNSCRPFLRTDLVKYKMSLTELAQLHSLLHLLLIAHFVGCKC